MRRPKIPIRKYFFVTLICALLLIFGFNLKEKELWKTKVSLQNSQYQQQFLKNLLNEKPLNKNQETVSHATSIFEEVNNGHLPEQTSSIVSTRQRKNKHFDMVSSNTYLAKNSLLDYNLQLISQVVYKSNSKPWFFRNGEIYPQPAKFIPRNHKQNDLKNFSPKLLSHEDPHNDRILNQLMYVPFNYAQIRRTGKLKTILLYNGLGPWNIKSGRDIFLRSKCPVDTCEITSQREKASSADMILYKDHFIPTGKRPSNPRQITMLYYLECPYHTQNVKLPNAINWTATYRRDSDIVAPYEKWQLYDINKQQMNQGRNYAFNKTKKVAWFVSNCGARNGRLQYAHELKNYIDVDIFGACGNLKCSRNTAEKCFEILDHDYKFYLAFENSNCRDYITEKFFVNALNRNILPIVMGARPEDYEISAPQRSYIHVDEFSSPKELAEYLNILDKDDTLYNSYFKWKGTGEFINTYFWCRVCSVLHHEESFKTPKWYEDINDWWRGAGVCTNGSWRNFKARKDIISED